MSRAETEGPGRAIGQAIRRRRTALGITGRQLAARAKISDTALSQIETGKTRHPWAEVIAKVAAALSTTTDDLLREAGLDVTVNLEEGTRKLYETLGQREREAWMKMGQVIRELQQAYETDVEEWEPTLAEPVAADSGDYAPDRRRIAQDSGEHGGAPED